MNILISIPCSFPYNSSPANLIRNLANGLSNQNINVSIHLLKGNSPENYRRFPDRINVLNNLMFQYCGFKKRPKNYLLKIFDDICAPIISSVEILKRKTEKKLDCVIIYTGYFYNYLPLIIICKILKIKIIKYSVDWYDKRIIAKKVWLLPKWHAFQFQIKYLDRLLNGIVSISRYLNDHYKKIGYEDKALLLIPNMLDLSKFENVNPKKKTEIIRIGYSGAALILNGVDLLIEAFTELSKKYKNIELLIVGDVAKGKSEIPQLKLIVYKNQIEDKVTFAGRVHSEQIPEIISSCDIFVLARKKSQFAEAGFPTKLGEYFALKTPVVLTTVGDFPFYFKDRQEVIFVEPDNYKSLGKGLEYLINNPNDAKIIGENGYRWAKENLDFKNNGKKIYDFINHI